MNYFLKKPLNRFNQSIIIFTFLFVSFYFCFPQNIYSQGSKKSKKEIPENMVLVPAGFFNMGSTKGFEDEYPVRSVWVDSFYIDKYLVTNSQFQKYCDETGRRYPQNPIWDTSYFLSRPNYPVVNITWDSAVAYAEWAGKRLPTEAEWEKAARGGTDTKYYCGDTLYQDNANFSGKAGKDKYRHTSPVGVFLPNPFGLYDMAGNVWQWCSDYYMSDFYWTTNLPNPEGPKKGTERVVRGGSWDSTYEYIRVSVRGKNAQTAKNSNVGFRCVVSVKDLK
jgi:formylglycine-generating enzyme